MLAGRYGQAVQNFFVEPAPLRDLEAIAMDNMREGCVGESWGALVGLYQAENAMDSVIADTMRSVALDEVDHASLSWEIHDWLSEQLNNDARMRVRKAQLDALDLLVAESVRPVVRSHALLVGLPEPHVALRLAKKLSQSLSG